MRGAAFSLIFGVTLALGFAGCAAGSPAAKLAEPPKLETKDARCAVQRSWEKPLIVEWPSADRLELEARAKSGPVVVAYSGCQMRMLSGCRVEGRYVFTPTTPKSDTIVMRNADELYATIPIGAAGFESKLEKYGQLNVSMTMVGRLAISEPEVGRAQLSGACKDATHVIAGITVGAFEFYAGAEATIGGGVDAVVAGAGAQSSAKRQTITRDGSPDACRSATGSDAAPPASCGAVLRVEVVPIEKNAQWRPLPAQTAKTAPSGVGRDKDKDTTCPPGTRRDGERCVARFNDDSSCSFVGDCSASCDAGRANACVTLGDLYATGKGGSRDLPRAAEAYRLGCDGGEGEGCLRLGQAYLYGNGVLEDPKRGVSLIELGCKKNHAESCSELGNLQIDGAKLKQDVQKGAANESRACDLGSSFACVRLAVLYKEGRKLLADSKKARHLFEKACKLGNQVSCAELKRSQTPSQ